MDNSQNRPISGQIEGVGDVSYTDILPDYKHSDHIEPILKHRRTMPIDPNACRSTEFPALAVVHRFDGRPEPVAAARLDLDERDLVLSTHNEIDIAVPTAKSMRNHLPPLPYKPTGGDALTKQTEILTRFRHGASLSRPSDKSRTGMTAVGRWRRTPRRPPPSALR